jgi:hypothetical protein
MFESCEHVVFNIVCHQTLVTICIDTVMYACGTVCIVICRISVDVSVNLFRGQLRADTIIGNL